MNRRKITKTATPKKINRQRDQIPWRYCLLALICGVFLVIGFFGAARQHFSSIEFGIKNSKLRKQIEELEAEQRRMLLNKEIVLSPAEIKKAAKKIGFTEMSASNIEILRADSETRQKADLKSFVEPKSLREISNSESNKKETKIAEKNLNEAKKTKTADSKESKNKMNIQAAKK